MTVRLRCTAVRVAVLALLLAFAVTGALASNLVLAAGLEEAAHACCDVAPGAASCVTLCASSNLDAKLPAFPDLTTPFADAAPDRLARPQEDNRRLQPVPVERPSLSLFLEYSVFRI